MARIKFTIMFMLLGMAACAPSPLYVSSPRIGTGGEIPRDGRGAPIWQAIGQPPPLPPAPNMPVGSGVPITPPA